VTYIDPRTGKRHDLQRRGQSKTHARDVLQALLREIDTTEGQGPLNERKTFTELCDYFEKHYVKAAEYVGGCKIAGVRSLGTAKGQLNVFARLLWLAPLAFNYSWRYASIRVARLAQETRTNENEGRGKIGRNLGWKEMKPRRIRSSLVCRKECNS
jgi:hypothetical protein